jgi:hypothetical protein
MNDLNSLFIWIDANFTAGLYMLSTQIQGIIWSLADIVLVYMLLKIADLIRKKTGKKPIRLRYYILYVTALLTPGLFIARTPQQIFMLEALVCGIQFCLLIYTVVVDRKDAIREIQKMISGPTDPTA